MPTYQYACTACGEQLEAVQSFTDAALTECPACQGRLRKVYSAVGVVFKGSGFYKTDSRSAGTRESSGEGKTESKTGTTSDAKTASKTDAGSSTTKGDSSTSKPAASASTTTPAAKSA